MKQITHLSLILMIFSAASGGLLSFVYNKTQPLIAQQREKEEQDSLKIVFPSAQTFEKKEISGKKYYEAKNAGGTLIGYVTKVKSIGYGGTIIVLAGIDLNEKITGIKILEHAETPGLGANIIGEKFTSQYRGQDVYALTVVKQPDNKNILALTGATISSKAVTDAVREGLVGFKTDLSSRRS